MLNFLLKRGGLGNRRKTALGCCAQIFTILQLLYEPVLQTYLLDEFQLCFAPIHVLFFVKGVCFENVKGLEVILQGKGQLLEDGHFFVGDGDIGLDVFHGIGEDSHFGSSFNLRSSAEVKDGETGLRGRWRRPEGPGLICSYP